MPTAWTYSSLESFETCPKKHYHTKVARDFKELPNESALWGDKVHKALETRVRDNTPLPDGMQQWETLASKLAALPGQKLTELEVGVSDSYEPTDYKKAWSRGKIDLVVQDKNKAIVLDYKTGKQKLTKQLSLYAGYVFSLFPQVDVIEAGFVWLKDKKISKETYYRSAVAEIWQEFLPRVRKLHVASEKNQWPERPSGLCNGWCPVKTCQHYKQK